MSYLLDKKIKRKKLITGAIIIAVFIFLVYFNSGIFNGLSYLSSIISRPVLVLENNISEKFRSMGSYFASKNSLNLENQNLRLELAQNKALMSNYDSILADNISLKEILGRKDEKIPVVLSAILEKPNQSLYDTLLVDRGSKDGIKEGDIVFAFGDVPLGRVSNVYPGSSKVILFSNSGERTQVLVGEKNVSMEAVGRGGGNFEIIMPKDFTLIKGDKVVLPGTVATILSDPRDASIKALLVSPVNIQELKFVEVELGK
jgi:rod shape-determining protein MreC